MEPRFPLAVLALLLTGCGAPPAADPPSSPPPAADTPPPVPAAEAPAPEPEPAAAPADGSAKDVPMGKAPALDGRLAAGEWRDALIVAPARKDEKSPKPFTLYLKHDDRCLYLAADCPVAVNGDEAFFILLGGPGAGSAPGAGDLEINFGPFRQSDPPWIESRGDGRAWVGVEEPSGWTARATAGLPERLHLECAVSLARFGPGEHPEARLGLLVTGARDLATPEGANLYSPDTWMPIRLAGGVAADPGQRHGKEVAEQFDLKERLAKAAEAAEAFQAARARHEDLLKLKEPRNQAEAVSLRQAVEAARQGFNKAVSLQPENPILPFVRGNFFYSMGDADTAFQDFLRAHRMAPGIGVILEPLCEAGLRSARYADVLAIAEAEAARRPERPGSYVRRGQVYQAVQRFDEAVADLEKAASFPATEEQRKVVDELLAASKALKAAWPAELEARERDGKADLPRAEIATARGRIVVELFEDDAPNTVANFVKLAEGKFYDGLRFHYAIGGFLAQAGDPRSRNPGDPQASSDGPGYRIKTQAGPRKPWRGSLCMSNTGPDTDGSQFFLLLKPSPQLDGKYAVFGRILEGQEAADALRPWDLVDSVKILRKRDHPYVPETMAPLPPKPLPGQGTLR